MKNLLQKIALAFSGAVASQVSAQLTFQPAQNVNQVVSNIFGLNCEDISTVTTVGNNYTFGIFSNGQSLGLNSGIVMATGNIFSFNLMNAQAFSSTDFQMPGDMNINQFNNGVSSFDAVSLQFSFTPDITDTISFRYIFASEEYPEYVYSQYNDRFLFLVSENGQGFQNVATVPGTTIPVEINSINQYQNTQYYIENNQSNPNSANFVFDGYTVPMYAKFFVQAGNTYTIKLVLADVNDGVFDSAIFLDEQASYSSISGDLAISGAPAQDGTIEIFDAAEDSTVAMPVFSVPVVNGVYSVDSIPGGNYHVRYLPDPVSNPGAMPVYFTSGSTWTGASLIGLPCFFNSTDLNAPSVSLTGPGSIGGTIYIDSSFQKSLPLPCANAVVLLRDVTTGTLVDYTKSNASGVYHFQNLPYGEYQVLLDVPYMPQLDSITVSITLTSLHGGNINHSIETDGIHSEISTLGITEDELIFNVLPNPAKGEITIHSEGMTGMDVQIVHANGQIVYRGKLESNAQKLNVQSLQSGIYFVKTGNKQHTKTIKLVLMN